MDDVREDGADAERPGAAMAEASGVGAAAAAVIIDRAAGHGAHSVNGSLNRRLDDVEVKLGDLQAQLGDVQAQLGDVQANLADLRISMGRLLQQVSLN